MPKAMSRAVGVIRGVVAVVALGAGSASQAAIIASESFAYAPGTVMRSGNLSGGSGFTSPWKLDPLPFSAGNWVIQSPTASGSPGSLGMGGGSTFHNTYIGSINRDLPMLRAGAPSDSFYLGFSFRRLVAGDSTTITLGSVGVQCSADGSYYIHQGGTSLRGINSGTIGARTGLFDQILLQAAGTSSGGVRLSLYVNPRGATPTPVATTTISTTTASFLRLVYVGKENVLQSSIIDDLRIGTGVVYRPPTIPAPSAAITIGSGLLFAARRRRT